jgi:hypothetical protein
MMQSDPIVAEIRDIREHRAARFGYEIRAIVKDAQARDAAGDREVVRLPPRRPEPAPHGARSPRNAD